MADTIFVLGAIATSAERLGTAAVRHGWWDTQWYYTRRTPKPVFDWLLETNVAHSVGWEFLPGRDDTHPFVIITFIIIHDPDAALELRICWDAKPSTLTQMRDYWRNEGRVTLAFGKGKEPR